jgi:hypothetical protein
MTMAKPICFVAMAFDKPDTDKMLNNLILPVLKRNKIVPIVVNRRQSNEDLNIQIIELLKICDFAIVDLTYARPSVYFEAGFAQHRCPVIYTVRKDHLKTGQPDDLKVHFDLQMKPIIPWINENDDPFSIKLEKRIISTFLKKWNLLAFQNQNIQKEINKFNALSLELRLRLLRSTVIHQFNQHGKMEWKPSRGSPNVVYSQSELLSGRVNFVHSILNSKTTLQFISVQSYQSILKDDLDRIRYLYEPSSIKRLVEKNLNIRDKLKKNIIARHYLISLKPLSSSKIESVFKDVPSLVPGKIYSAEYNTRESENIIFSHLIFLTGIRCPSDLNGNVLPDLKQYSSQVQKYLNKLDSN